MTMRQFARWSPWQQHRARRSPQQTRLRMRCSLDPSCRLWSSARQRCSARAVAAPSSPSFKRCGQTKSKKKKTKGGGMVAPANSLLTLEQAFEYRCLSFLLSRILRHSRCSLSLPCYFLAVCACLHACLRVCACCWLVCTGAWPCVGPPKLPAQSTASTGG